MWPPSRSLEFRYSAKKITAPPGVYEGREPGVYAGREAFLIFSPRFRIWLGPGKIPDDLISQRQH